MTDRLASLRATRTRALVDAGAVAVLRLDDPATVLPVAEALAEGGITALELTMTMPDAPAHLAALCRALGEAVLPGMGTVRDAAAARQALDAGARFLVSPVFDAGVLATAHAAGVPAVPGAFTPTEIVAAHEAGADVVKVFPAGVLGPAYLRAVLAPLPGLRLLPTGGVTLDDAADWLRAGACAVGLGTALVDPDAVARGRYDVLTDRARRLRDRLARIRTP